MRILVLAPQPFFQERGTPIAVRMLLEVLAERYTLSPDLTARGGGPDEATNNSIDVLTYHEGTPARVPGVKQHRIHAPRWLRNIKPGISIKKIIADWYFFWKTINLIWANRKQQFSLIHAIEESVFIAWFCKRIFSIPYVYDMDSSLSLQLTESWRPLRVFRPIFEKLEGLVIRDSLVVVPVCESLAEAALAHGAAQVKLLTDVCIFSAQTDQASKSLQIEDSSKALRQHLYLTADQTLVLYVGNLQPYQGVELLVEAFFKALERYEQLHGLRLDKVVPATLAIIGGTEKEVDKLRLKYKELNQTYPNSVRFLGARPLEQLSNYLSEADILASPRINGNNTPMKIYNYLASGKAIIATDIISHTQVLDHSVAVLCAPTVPALAQGLQELIANRELRSTLGRAGAQLAKTKYTPESFRENVCDIYNYLESAVQQAHSNRK